MAQSHRYIAVFLTGLLVLAAPGASARPVMLEIVEGDTSFVVDEATRKAWWVVGACRRPIPLESARSGTEKSKSASLSSQVLRETVELGSRRVELRQQFRFNLGEGSASVDVYNSVRGGWAPVPVRANAVCNAQSECRRRMELPECSEDF